MDTVALLVHAVIMLISAITLRLTLQNTREIRSMGKPKDVPLWETEYWQDYPKNATEGLERDSGLME